MVSAGVTGDKVTIELPKWVAKRRRIHGPERLTDPSITEACRAALAALNPTEEPPQ